MIKNYVDTNYPELTKKYYTELNNLKHEEINKLSEIVYIHNNLMWQDNDKIEDLTLTAVESKLYCKKLNLALRKDWRVPSQKELIQLINFYNYEPASLNGFNYFKSNIYWSSSKDLNHKDNYWIVDFQYGQTMVPINVKNYYYKCIHNLYVQQ
jgi:hypothetical protein